jgi:hypothetical protein
VKSARKIQIYRLYSMIYHRPATTSWTGFTSFSPADMHFPLLSEVPRLRLLPSAHAGYDGNFPKVARIPLEKGEVPEPASDVFCPAHSKFPRGKTSIEAPLFPVKASKLVGGQIAKI